MKKPTWLYIVFTIIPLGIMIYGAWIKYRTDTTQDLSIVLYDKSAPTSERIKILIALRDAEDEAKIAYTDHHGRCTFENLKKGDYTYYFTYKNKSFEYPVSVWGKTVVKDTQRIGIDTSSIPVKKRIDTVVLAQKSKITDKKAEESKTVIVYFTIQTTKPFCFFIDKKFIATLSKPLYSYYNITEYLNGVRIPVKIKTGRHQYSLGRDMIYSETENYPVNTFYVKNKGQVISIFTPEEEL